MKQSLKRLRCMFILIVFFSSGLVLVDNVMFCKAQTGTQVGGVLWDNTTWTAANSPYIITGTVQIPSNVTLTIEPDVTVMTTKGPNSGYLFLLNGVILAQGKPNKMITFDAAGLGLFSAKNSNNDTSIDLDYCIIKNSATIWDSQDHTRFGYINLRHSSIGNITKAMVNLIKPEKNCFIEYNTFENTSFAIAISSKACVYIRYNLFNGKNPNPNYLIGNYLKGPDNLFVEYNSFINMQGGVLSIEGGSGMSATNNYWGTTDLGLIKSMIRDNSTDITCSAALNYLPVLQEPSPSTPVLSPTPSSTPVITPTSTESLEPLSTPTTTTNENISPIESNIVWPKDWIWQAVIIAVAVGIIVVACALVFGGKVKFEKASKP